MLLQNIIWVFGMCLETNFIPKCISCFTIVVEKSLIFDKKKNRTLEPSPLWDYFLFSKLKIPLNGIIYKKKNSRDWDRIDHSTKRK